MYRRAHNKWNRTNYEAYISKRIYTRILGFVYSQKMGYSNFRTRRDVFGIGHIIHWSESSDLFGSRINRSNSNHSKQGWDKKSCRKIFLRISFYEIFFVKSRKIRKIRKIYGPAMFVRKTVISFAIFLVDFRKTPHRP